MKLLYGIQGTGNGHITRARAVSRYFTEFGIKADYLFSGRPREQYFDMSPFGEHWRSMQGLSFVHRSGRLDVWNTVKQAQMRTLVKNVRELELDSYDLVLTDFEPITAWAARHQGKASIGIGHQYAFLHHVPKAGVNWVSQAIMKHFAPADYSLGLHWHHFNTPILPPIAETDEVPQELVEPDKILVYFGFEAPDDVIQLLEPFGNHTFVYYGPFKSFENLGHIQLKPLSRAGFQHDLALCGGVISNAGFELASEAIQLGKKLLVKPLQGQMEQLSNAVALEQLQFGLTMASLNKAVLAQWLNEFKPCRVHYPNVAREIVRWISNGQWQCSKNLRETLWQQTRTEAPKKARAHLPCQAA